MGFYFRKSFRAGPLRLNLSRRGVGASIGVRGARVGVDATGHEYVHAGRGGLYYRARGPRIAAGGGRVVVWLAIAALLALGISALVTR